ncbi:hypothetical protein LJB76_02860 [Clostridia bacterium OttesenSCG-928-O13]|nr:hypothetical protein [Clostridia bacterium OttesenSCG-928-O13]
MCRFRFRAVDTRYGQPHEGLLVYDSGTICIIKDKAGIQWDCWSESIQPFTGKTDVDGVDVYAGDVVKNATGEPGRFTVLFGERMVPDPDEEGMDIAEVGFYLEELGSGEEYALGDTECWARVVNK